MIIKALKTRSIHTALLLLALYFIAVLLVPVNLLVELLNGFFIGTLFTVIAVYRKVVWESLIGAHYTRVQQYAIGAFLIWIAFAVTRFSSIWFRANGYTAQVIYLDYVNAFAIYTAVCAGFFQLTAPGWDEGYMHGRDKATLVLLSVVGLCVSFFVFWIQERY